MKLLDGPNNAAPEAPIVSVVIATYNRPVPLRHAIQSVLDGTFTDWELIVVGDACTDDTAECVTSFGDNRIRFVNLPVRCGYQSGPNNHGVELARGRYIAFLNHDDLYLPDHLATCVAELDASGVDFVWVPTARATAKSALTREEVPCGFVLGGVPPASEYSPYSFYFASSWVFRRALIDRVGQWRAPENTYLLPSQDWLFRAWRSGAALRFIPRVSVILVPAGYRPGSYASRESLEHEALASWIKADARFREHLLEEVAVSEATQRMTRLYHPPLRVIGRIMIRPLYVLLVKLGIHPLAFSRFIFRKRLGEQIHRHRRNTGSG